MRRGKIELIRDILKIVTNGGAGGVNKTKVVYGANLNFERASRMLEWLIEEGLVKTGSDRYIITEKGEAILSDIKRVVGLFK